MILWNNSKYRSRFCISCLSGNFFPVSWNPFMKWFSESEFNMNFTHKLDNLEGHSIESEIFWIDFLVFPACSLCFVPAFPYILECHFRDDSQSDFNIVSQRIPHLVELFPERSVMKQFPESNSNMFSSLWPRDKRNFPIILGNPFHSDFLNEILSFYQRHGTRNFPSRCFAWFWISAISFSLTFVKLFSLYHRNIHEVITDPRTCSTFRKLFLSCGHYVTFYGSIPIVSQHSISHFVRLRITGDHSMKPIL
jgi:hypothetical protein